MRTIKSVTVVTTDDETLVYTGSGTLRAENTDRHPNRTGTEHGYITVSLALHGDALPSERAPGGSA